MIDLSNLFAGDIVKLVRARDGDKWPSFERPCIVERILGTPHPVTGNQILVAYVNGWKYWARPDQVEYVRAGNGTGEGFFRATTPAEDYYRAKHNDYSDDGGRDDERQAQAQTRRPARSPFTWGDRRPGG